MSIFKFSNYNFGGVKGPKDALNIGEVLAILDEFNRGDDLKVNIGHVYNVFEVFDEGKVAMIYADDYFDNLSVGDTIREFEKFRGDEFLLVFDGVALRSDEDDYNESNPDSDVSFVYSDDYNDEDYYYYVVGYHDGVLQCRKYKR